MAINAVQTNKTVADPVAAYESMHPLWQRNRAVCGGERFVKELDAYIDTTGFKNILIPFSPSMTQKQYDFLKAEAELPGVVANYTKMVIGGLLRKKPQLELPKDAPADAKDWIIDNFGEDESSIAAFLDKALWEEMQTSRCWIQVDYPKVENRESLSKQEILSFKPYPIMWNAESVINWRVSKNASTGATQLTRILIRTYEENFDKNEFHSELVDTIYVHELVEGFYQIRKFQQIAPTSSVPVVNGKTQQEYANKTPQFELVEAITDIESNGERVKIIPFWPLNGSIEITEPIITQLVDKEVSLYNKITRRNHLMYGAATYTPWVASNMTDEEFNKIVEQGLGTWLRLQQGDTAGVLETPSSVLADMASAISSAFDEMAKLGVRMLTPETAQSGVALDIRNASQTAQLGTLNTKVSNTISDIIAFMLNWRYGTEYTASDIKFSMSADFNPAPLGDLWLRLITEWYQSGLIPRFVWLQILKANDIVPPEYDDAVAQQEIANDELIITPAEQMGVMLQQQQQIQQQG